MQLYFNSNFQKLSYRESKFSLHKSLLKLIVRVLLLKILSLVGLI